MGVGRVAFETLLSKRARTFESAVLDEIVQWIGGCEGQRADE
jgi:hypothetical protein